MMTSENGRRPSDPIELKLTVSEAARRQLKMLAAEAGCSMSDYVEEWISTTWKRSPIFQERMKQEGTWWYDEQLRRHRPDGSLADGDPTAAQQGGAR